MAAESIGQLLTPEAVRERCTELLTLGCQGKLHHFSVDLNRLDNALDRVVEISRRSYPDGIVPLHSRWRHFQIGENDYWRQICNTQPDLSGAALARSRFDLAIISVLLDAGAGAKWRYVDNASGLQLARSEGLALASLRWFASGTLSHCGTAMRANAERLAELQEHELAQAFQVSERNPLLGLEGRTRLLNRLGRVMVQQPEIFGQPPNCRPGGLFDYLKRRAGGGSLPARKILIALLVYLGDIWPQAHRIGNASIGDIGRHPAVQRDDETNGLVPFHKLSQWLAYSLIEPLEEAAIQVIDLDALTGLAEYRNGGLFLDSGVVRLKTPESAAQVHKIDSELVVEWRALAVALLDRLAVMMRQRLGKSQVELPLCAVLQGGTWSAGRQLARERRADGGPPLKIDSAGTVF